MLLNIIINYPFSPKYIEEKKEGNNGGKRRSGVKTWKSKGIAGMQQSTHVQGTSLLKCWNMN